MAGVKNKSVADLTLKLSEPGLTPILRAGLGGLATSLRATGLAGDASYKWPDPVKLGPGEAIIERQQITLRWNDDPEAVLRELFEKSFRIREGVIDLPGIWRPGRWALGVAAALQTGYKRTFLQHGKTTKKDGAARTKQIEIDERLLSVSYQPYVSFAHQEAYVDVLKALRGGSVALAGWANPGAVDRHLAYGNTEWSYSATQALCGLFAIVGCLSFQVTQSGGAGALVIPEPNDLVKFAVLRPLLTPNTVAESHVAGASDAVLFVNLLMRMEETAAAGSCIASTHGVTLRATPWASQQKSRVSTVRLGQIPAEVLDAYETATQMLPNRILVKRSEEEDAEEGSGYFAVASALRGFVADNLANGRRWFDGFATAVTPEKQPKFLHRYRTANDNLGALRAEDRKGLIEMTKQLDEAEAHLVRAVHVALRNRFGAIAKETKELPSATRKKRFQNERDKWRLLFAGAKTQEQVRAGLSELWGRAGTNAELQAHWQEVLPLLRAEHWQAARDLALIGLASYQGKGTPSGDEDDEGDHQADSTEDSAD